MFFSYSGQICQYPVWGKNVIPNTLRQNVFVLYWLCYSEIICEVWMYKKEVFGKLNVFLYFVQCFFYLICALSEGWDIVRVINNYIILCPAVSTALRTGASIFKYPMYQNGGFHSCFELCVSKVSCLPK